MATQKTYREAAEITNIDMSPSLEEIEGENVLLHKVTVTMRPMRGAEREFVEVEVSPIEDPTAISPYHAWSPSLAERVARLQDSDLPVLAKFIRVKTGSGFKVWTIGKTSE